jgi:Ca2+-binding EF-hand superfamily protein
MFCLCEQVKQVQDALYRKRFTIKDAFRKMDADMDGYVSIQELLGFLSELGVESTEAQLRSMLGIVDVAAPKATGGASPSSRGSVAYSTLRQILGARVTTYPRQSDWEETVFQELRKWMQRRRMTSKSAFAQFAGTGTPPKMSATDLKTALRSVAPQMTLASWQVEHLLHLMDSDGNGKISADEWNRRFETTTARWDSSALRKLRDTLYLQKISPAAFLRQCDSNRDGCVSAAELQRTFVNVVEGLSNAEAAELVRELMPGGTKGRAAGKSKAARPDLNKLHELLTQNPAANGGSEERLLKRVRDKLLTLPGGAEHAIANAFQSFDTDGDGSLSREEFRRGIGSLQLGLGVHEIDRLLDLADENGDIPTKSFVSVKFQAN